MGKQMARSRRESQREIAVDDAARERVEQLAVDLGSTWLMAASLLISVASDDAATKKFHADIDQRRADRVAARSGVASRPAEPPAIEVASRPAEPPAIEVASRPAEPAGTRSRPAHAAGDHGRRDTHAHK